MKIKETTNEAIITNRLQVLDQLVSRKLNEDHLESEHFKLEQNKIITILANDIINTCPKTTGSPSPIKFWQETFSKITLIEAHIKDAPAPRTLTPSFETIQLAAIQQAKEALRKALFEKTLTDWCNEKQGKYEYDNRVRAAEKIRECYASGGTSLDLS